MAYIISGVSRGLGKDLALHYLSLGFDVIGLSRSPSGITSNNFTEVHCDLSKIEDIKAAIVIIRKLELDITVLINSAGVGDAKMLMLEDPEKVRETFLVNSVAPILLTQAVSRLMRKNKYGRIVNIGSIHEKLKPPGSVAYTSSKSALSSITEVASKELFEAGITVNTVNLGVYDSDMSNSLDKDFLSLFLKTLPIKEKVLLHDVILVIDFFTSKKSGFITGQTISMSGVN